VSASLSHSDCLLDFEFCHFSTGLKYHQISLQQEPCS